MKRTSLTEKMVLYFLALGIGSIIITGFFSFFTAQRALLERTYDQLTSIRLTRQARIENFFTDRLRETAFFSKSESAIKLSNELSSGHLPDTSSLSLNYGNLILASGYYEGFIILDSTGKTLYSNSRENSRISLTKVLDRQPYNPGSDEAVIIDYSSNGSGSERKLLSLSDIRSDTYPTTYLALIIRSEKINEIMLEVGPSNGFGYSGETYLVGDDHLMRSESRFIRNSVMKTRVITLPVINSLNNTEGIDQVTDYRGIEVLSSYGRINAKGLHWVILAEIDYKEATASIYTIRNNILILTVFTGLAFFVISFVISRRITRPLIKLKNAAIELGEGRLNSLVVIESEDEIGALTDAFNRMALNIKEKDEALKVERLNRLRSAIDGQDQERQRLSREMHDGLGQSLIAVRLRLGALENNVTEKIRQELQTIISLTDNLIDEVRAISNALMPPALAEFGLAAAVHHLCNNLTETNGIKTLFEGEIPGQLLGRKARLYIFRIIQEALNNAAKHSGASTIKIVSHIKENLLYISISDNGKGFDPESSCANNGHGLNNIRERVSLLKGTTSITSSPEKGTEIQIEVPVNKITS